MIGVPLMLKVSTRGVICLAVAECAAVHINKLTTSVLLVYTAH